MSAQGTQRRLYHNWMSYLGTLMMATAIVGGFLLTLFEFASPTEAPYMGLNYIAFIALLLAGAVAVPFGMLRERRRRRLHLGEERATGFHLDLTNPTHIYAAISALAGGMVILMLVGFGSYRSYQASESASFCGELCHSVMHPEWTTYHSSAHARVACVECHIGPGAGWFVRSKFSGLRQVWAVSVDSFPRPIPTPIHDLRPARETCEECHWRRKFTGFKEEVRSYYLSDEENSIDQVRMLVKIGGEKTAFLKGSGIHYHMLIASKVEYAATDESRQEMAWVKVTRGDGSVTEYWNSDSGLAEEDLKDLEVRQMDCMDCHNRPAHQFLSPVDSVNRALDDGTISVDLPYIKREAVTALDADYETTDEAVTGIANSIRSFYRDEYPEILDKRSDELIASIRKVQEIYRNTIFPTMKAEWSVYPNNIGHMESPGCFRCHNDSMEADDGTTVFTDCNRCHVIIAQGESIEQINVSLDEGLDFVHPADYEAIDEFEPCSDCHTGGAEIFE